MRYKFHEDGRLASAREYLESILSRWAAGDVPYGLAVEAPLCVLVEAAGGQSWIVRHPGFLKQPPELLREWASSPQDKTVGFLYEETYLFMDEDDVQRLLEG